MLLRAASIVIASLLACTSVSMTAPPASAGRGHRDQQAVIVKVLDGDTIKVRVGHETQAREVQLLGVRAPRIYGPGDAFCGAREARRALRGMLPVGTRVVLRPDPAFADPDRGEDRLMYVAKATSGLDVAHEQLRSGLVKVRRHHGKDFARQDAYRLTQRAAKRERRGSWDSCWSGDDL